LPQQTILFADQTPGFDYDATQNYDPSFLTDTADLDLNKWLSRPRVIKRYEWDANAIGSFAAFDPWAEFWDLTKDKWSTFGRIRHKLHIKVLINGNGFYMGRMLVSYNPNGDLAGFIPSRALIVSDAVRESQRPHIWVDPTTSTGGELTLPFHHVNPFYSTSQILEISKPMGDMVFRVISPLQHANLTGMDVKVNLTVYAWASDLMLDTPTDHDPFVAQAGDEYGTGVVSRPANILSRMAKSVAFVPGISKYALATSTFASAVGRVAQMFGFSRPPLISEPLRQYPIYFGDLATTEGSDTLFRLSMDPKQEVTIDPSTIGLPGIDEMALDYLTHIESYFYSFTWTSAQPVGDRLVDIPVQPMAMDKFFEEHHLTAIAAASLPFGMWRGSIKYRFQIVSTAFHKGRISLVWDPIVGSSYDVAQQVVIDIGERRDFTVEVGYASQKNYMRTMALPQAWANRPSPSPAPPDIEVNNGNLSLYVHTPLTTPTQQVAAVSVLVSVCAGDDFELANPSDSNIRALTYFQPPAPALFEPQAGADEYAETPGKPGSSELVHTFNKTRSPPAAIIQHGDPVTSLRQMAKRYVLHDNIIINKVVQNDIWQRTLSNFPPYRGAAPLAAAGYEKYGVPYNYANNGILTVYAPCYLGYRGSIRWKIHGMGPRLAHISAVRLPFASTSGPGTLTKIEPPSGTDAKGVAALSAIQVSGNAGMASTPYQFPVLAFDLPYYSENLYQEVTNAPESNVINNFHRLSVMQSDDVNSNTSRNFTTLQRHVAIGEDFNFFFFKGMPPIFHDLEVYPPA